MKIRSVVLTFGIWLVFIGLSNFGFAQTEEPHLPQGPQELQQMEASKAAWQKAHPEEKSKVEAVAPKKVAPSKVDNNTVQNPWGIGASYDIAKKEAMFARGEVVVASPPTSKHLIDRKEYNAMPKEKQDQIAAHPELYQISNK